MFDIEGILASIDTMAAQRPVAAQIVSVANGEDTSAKELSRILASDVALASRVMKLANSAYFGMRGRVSSLQFAVTVVGFTTVKTMATVALTDLDDESRLPEDFWLVTTSLALGASTLAPRFGERPQDALCIGLLAQMGAALLHHNDPEGYAEIVAAEPTYTGRRAAETRRYGLNSLKLTAVALEQWGFPHSMTSRAAERRRLPLDRGRPAACGLRGRLAADHRGLRAGADRPAVLRSAPRGRPRPDARPGPCRRRRAAPGDARRLTEDPVLGVAQARPVGVTREHG